MIRFNEQRYRSLAIYDDPHTPYQKRISGARMGVLAASVSGNTGRWASQNIHSLYAILYQINELNKADVSPEVKNLFIDNMLARFTKGVSRIDCSYMFYKALDLTEGEGALADSDKLIANKLPAAERKRLRVLIPEERNAKFDHIRVERDDDIIKLIFDYEIWPKKLLKDGVYLGENLLKALNRRRVEGAPNGNTAEAHFVYQKELDMFKNATIYCTKPVATTLSERYPALAPGIKTVDLDSIEDIGVIMEAGMAEALGSSADVTMVDACAKYHPAVIAATVMPHLGIDVWPWRRDASLSDANYVTKRHIDKKHLSKINIYGRTMLTEGVPLYLTSAGLLYTEEGNDDTLGVIPYTYTRNAAEDTLVEYGKDKLPDFVKSGADITVGQALSYIGNTFDFDKDDTDEMLYAYGDLSIITGFKTYLNNYKAAVGEGDYNRLGLTHYDPSCTYNCFMQGKFTTDKTKTNDYQKSVEKVLTKWFKVAAVVNKLTYEQLESLTEDCEKIFMSCKQNQWALEAMHFGCREAFSSYYRNLNHRDGLLTFYTQAMYTVETLIQNYGITPITAKEIIAETKIKES